MERFKIIPGGKPSRKIYKGLRGLDKEKNIVASSQNEAYALLLDHEYGKDPSSLSVTLENERLILKALRNQPSGIY